MIVIKRSFILLSGLLLAITTCPLLAEEAKSGYEYIKPATRAMQDDDFENPGMLSVERGLELFNEKQDSTGKACSDCHGADAQKMNPQSIARYPVYDENRGGIVTLQKSISYCFNNIGSIALPTNLPDLIAL